MDPGVKTVAQLSGTRCALVVRLGHDAKKYQRARENHHLRFAYRLSLSRLFETLRNERVLICRVKRLD
jgi:hypothetical protein